MKFMLIVGALLFSAQDNECDQQFNQCMSQCDGSSLMCTLACEEVRDECKA